jgi:DNA-binding beta-propeller fold protein YncE
VAIAGGPHDLAIAPDGKSAYVVSVLDNIVSQYRINRQTGKLSANPVSTAATGLRPENIVMAPDGKNAYVDSENDGTVSQYKINPVTGKIARMSPATVVTASGSIGMAITP